MKKEHIFKGGFEIGEDQKRNFFAYQLMVYTEGMDSQEAYKLSQAVDREYRKMLAKQCEVEEGGMEQWLYKLSE